MINRGNQNLLEAAKRELAQRGIGGQEICEGAGDFSSVVGGVAETAAAAGSKIPGLPVVGPISNGLAVVQAGRDIQPAIDAAYRNNAMLEQNGPYSDEAVYGPGAPNQIDFGPWTPTP